MGEFSVHVGSVCDQHRPLQCCPVADEAAIWGLGGKPCHSIAPHLLRESRRQAHRVLIGGKLCNIASVTGTEIKCHTPPSSASSKAVRMRVRAGTGRDRGRGGRPVAREPSR